MEIIARREGVDYILKKKESNLFLASASPRRREILAEGGIAHKVLPADVDEAVFEGMEPRLMVQLLAAAKAAAAAGKCEGLVLGADTVVVLSGKVMGKPKDGEEAFSMLSALSGKTHSVYTGVCILRTEDGRLKTHLEETKVTFRSLSETEIRAYIETGEPMDKAGAYGIQGLGGKLVEKTEGDFLNVVGLPLEAVKRLIREFGEEQETRNA